MVRVPWPLHRLVASGVMSCFDLAAGGVFSYWFPPTAEAALALDVTLLDKPLRLLSGLDSEPSKLGTLRIVAVLPRACFTAAFAGGPVMLFMAPVEAAVSVLVDGSSSGLSVFGSFGAADLAKLTTDIRSNEPRAVQQREQLAVDCASLYPGL